MFLLEESKTSQTQVREFITLNLVFLHFLFLLWVFLFSSAPKALRDNNNMNQISKKKKITIYPSPPAAFWWTACQINIILSLFNKLFTTTFIDFYIALAKKILLLANETLKCMNFSETANSLLIKAKGNILFLQNLSTTHFHVLISKPQWVSSRNTQLDLKALKPL